MTRLEAWTIWFWLLALVILIGLFITGQMQPWVSPDTASWLAGDWSLSSFSLPRFPLYGWLVAGAARIGVGEGAWPWLQDGAYILATWWLAHAVRRRGASQFAVLAIGIASLLSSAMLVWGRAILPDIPAAAALLAALACTVRRRIALAAIFGALAYLLKPSLLPFIGGLPVILLLDGAPIRQAGRLMFRLAIPFLLISTLRLAMVGDFNIVSFGGFQMSGLAALMMTPDTIERLPPALRPDAQDILTRRDALIAAGRTLAVPMNTSGARSFPSVAAGYPDLLARTYDDTLYGAVSPIQRPTETWPAFNTRLQRLAVATIVAEPLDYAAWIVGGIARLVGRMLVFNPGMLLAAGLILYSLLRGPRPGGPGHPEDVRLLLILTLVHAAGASMLVILASFPAARYIDCAGSLTAALPIYAGMRMVVRQR